jgi:hypothetical protein
MEKTHDQIWDRMKVMEGEMMILRKEMDHTSSVVTRNQEEFKSRITGLESQNDNLVVELTKLTQTYKVGTAMLGFLISAGIALLAIIV